VRESDKKGAPRLSVSARRCAGVSGRLNIAKPIQRLRPPVLRHQAEAQIIICAKPGAHEAHMGRTRGIRQAYARRKKKLKSL
jgi:hypothetical protein